MENYIAACNEQQEANNNYDSHCTVPHLLPIHLAPLFSIFLPQVVTKMYQTMQFADEAVGWAVLVEEDSNSKELYTAERMQPPELLGMRG
jgi:hypothetical protein